LQPARLAFRAMDATAKVLPPGDEALDRDRVIEAPADVGTMWLERDAELLTPAVLKYGAWAPEIGALMRRLLRPGMTFVDVGANVGYFSVLGSKLVGPSGRVFCIEADPANVAILRANLWRNGCSNAKVFPVAAWSERTKLNLRTNPEGGAGSSVGMDDQEAAGLDAFRVDQLVDGRVDYMKVDCESTDHMVVSGTAELFRANPRMIATVEFNPDHTSHTGHTPRQILDLYRGLGLRPFLISPHGLLGATTYERLAASGSSVEQVIYDFALSPTRPLRLVLPYYVDVPLERLLRVGGDLLEYVPEPIRPKIRRRDRLEQRRSSAAGLD
jgi:FkbM family methyltransferase